MFLMVTIKLE
uniref:Uncharacterized protein n=1 Tax=Arundo donax TaxID=35708 RepID=A0A0A9BGS6_ARUDO